MGMMSYIKTKILGDPNEDQLPLVKGSEKEQFTEAEEPSRPMCSSLCEIMSRLNWFGTKPKKDKRAGYEIIAEHAATTGCFEVLGNAFMDIRTSMPALASIKNLFSSSTEKKPVDLELGLGLTKPTDSNYGTNKSLK